MEVVDQITPVEQDKENDAHRSSATTGAVNAATNQPMDSNTNDEYFAKLTSTLKTPTKITRLSERPDDIWSRSSQLSNAVQPSVRQLDRPASKRASARFSGVVENESLLDGFVLLRLAQLLNFDVHYIGQSDTQRRSQSSSRHSKTPLGAWLLPNTSGEHKSESRQQLNVSDKLESGENSGQLELDQQRRPQQQRQTLIDELAAMNPFQRWIEHSSWLNGACRLLKICLSLVAIMISLDKTISTILLCLLSRADIRARPGNIGIAYEASDVSMSWFVLVLVNISAMYILFSTVFNGHLLWKLLSQRLFLVSRRFQYKTMLSLILFVYLEYLVNISFINNLFGWPFGESSGSETPTGAGTSQLVSGKPSTSYNIHTSYSVLSNLEIFVTQKNERNKLVDILLTIFQFARGIIRISPYITINYVIICLNEQIKTIRNQTILTESLKKRPKLGLVVKSQRRRALNGTLVRQEGNMLASVSRSLAASSSGGGGSGGVHNGSCNRKKRVIFVTETTGFADNSQSGQFLSANRRSTAAASPTPSFASSSGRSKSLLDFNALEAENVMDSTELERTNCRMIEKEEKEKKENERLRYLTRIEDFNELESYITNLYIFTDRLNRLMSQQGLALFFIVHNLIITCSLIVPEAISGGPPMVVLIRLLVILVGIVPFFCGQSLNGQLDQLSKQIDRIIIQQKFIGRKRDNLVRIRELLHDIRVNCGGMLNFNVETGIKYLVVAFASAFFIEQEGEFVRPQLYPIAARAAPLAHFHLRARPQNQSSWSDCITNLPTRGREAQTSASFLIVRSAGQTCRLQTNQTTLVAPDGHYGDARTQGCNGSVARSHCGPLQSLRAPPPAAAMLIRLRLCMAINAHA